MLLPFEVSWDRASGRFSFVWKGHVLAAIGGILLTAGLAALAAPWWYPIVAIALRRWGVTAEPATNWLLGAVLCALSLGCYSLKFFVVDALAKKIAADKLVVQRRQPNPDAIRHFLDGLTTDDDYRSSQSAAFQAEYHLYANPEDRLSDKRAAKAFDAFALSAAKLHHFMAQHFDWWPPNQLGWDDHRYCLAPHLNIDRGNHGDLQGMKAYDALQEQLDSHVREVREKYEALLVVLRTNGSF